MTLLILAGGMGSRYGGEKQYDDIGPCGEFLLEYNIYDAIQVGFQEIVIVTNEASKDAIYDYLRSRIPAKIKLSCVAQLISDVPIEVSSISREKPWGTAHAVWSARKVINGTFVTLNADDLYGREGLADAMTLCKKIGSNESTYGIVTYHLEQTISKHGSVSRGVCEVANESLMNVVEHTKIRFKNKQLIDEASGILLERDSLASMNLWVLQPSIFEEIEKSLLTNLVHMKAQGSELYLPNVIQQLIDYGDHEVLNQTTQSEWVGMTYKEDRKSIMETLVKLSKKGVYPSPLWK